MTKKLSCGWRYSTGVVPFTGVWIWGQRGVTLAARDVLLNAGVPSTASRFASSSDPGKKNLWEHFRSPCGSNFTLSGRFQVGDMTGRLNLWSSLCFVALDFIASWRPSWFCFPWNRFLPPGFLCQNNVFLLSSSEFTTTKCKKKKKQKKLCMAKLDGKDDLHALRPNFRREKLKRKQYRVKQIKLIYNLDWIHVDAHNELLTQAFIIKA